MTRPTVMASQATFARRPAAASIDIAAPNIQSDFDTGHDRSDAVTVT